MTSMKAMTRREALLLLSGATAAMATRGVAQQVTAGKYA
jgi:hypothetical protein